MKASEVILLLQQAIVEHGDKRVLMELSDEVGDVRECRFENTWGVDSIVLNSCVELELVQVVVDPA